MKRLLAFVLACVLLISSLAVPALADSFDITITEPVVKTEGIFTYEIANGEVMILYCNNRATGPVVVPDTLDGYPVTAIDIVAFAGCDRMTSVSIPSSVKKIGEGAFLGCSALESMTIPFVGGSIKTSDDINQYPFGYIFGKTEYTGSTRAGQYYYGPTTDATTYTDYYIPTSLKSVTVTGGELLYGAFYNCTTLESITLPEGVTRINSCALRHCSSLRSITIPSTVTTIGSQAFRNCIALESIALGAKVTSIVGAAFRDCSALKQVIYCGTAEQWEDLEIGSQNVPFTSAKMQYHNYENGACSICGAKDPNARPQIYGVSRMKNLSLDGVIYVYGYVGFTDANQTKNMLSKDYVLQNGQVLYWSAADMAAAEEPVLGTQTHISGLSDAGSYGGIDEYLSISHGIAAKEYNDTIYYRTYIEVDGEACYGEIIEYSVVTYCKNQLKKTDANAQKLKPLLAALLNYGTAAQNYLTYDPNNPANACLWEYAEQGLLDEKYLSMGWDEGLLTDVVAPTAEMTVNFAQSGNTVRTVRNLALEGAVEIKMTMAYRLTDRKGTQIPDDAQVMFYFWSGTDYEKLKAAGQVLTTENASCVVQAVTEEYSDAYGYEYSAKSEGIPAKQLGETVYVTMVVTEADGTVCCSGIEAYSPEAYAKTQLAKDIPLYLQYLLQWMTVYGEAAKTYFNS